MIAPRVAIVGLGVIGGSLARALSGRGWRVRALSPNADERDAAARNGLDAGNVDDETLATTAREVPLIVLAVPISVLSDVATGVVLAAPESALVLHTCSLLSPSALGLDDALASRLLGTHPLAGSHAAGFAASDPAIFSGCTVAVEERASPSARRSLEQLWTDAGAGQFVYLDAQAHDRAVAWTSHLPQLAATALAATLAAAVADLSLTGPGLRDTSRLAMSPFPLWRPILSAAPAEASRALAALEQTIHELRVALERDDIATIEEVWQRASRWRGAIRVP